MAADASDLRRSAFLLLAAAAVAIAAAKTVGAENVIEPSRYKAENGGYGYEQDRPWPDKRPDPMPTFSSNDKSRWATVRALVHNRTFVIGRRDYDTKYAKGWEDQGIVAEPAYRSLDIVMNPETKEFYSSKPPLMATLVACEYWLLNRGFGWDIDRDRWLVIPAIVLTWNVLPFAIYLLLLGPADRRHGQDRFRETTRVRCRGTGYIPADVLRHTEQPLAGRVLRAVRELSAVARDPREPRHDPARLRRVRVLRGVRGYVRTAGAVLLRGHAHSAVDRADAEHAVVLRAVRAPAVRGTVPGELRGARASGYRRTASSAGRGTTSRAATGRSAARPMRRVSTSTTSRR